MSVVAKRSPISAAAENLLISTGRIALSAKRRHLNYSEAEFEVFRPALGHVALLRAKFHPHRCNGKGIGPQK